MSLNFVSTLPISSAATAHATMSATAPPAQVHRRRVAA
jgi:hypothetical protein